MRRAVAGLLAVTLVTTGCSSMKPEDFADREPRFRPEEYFVGRTRGWGVFEDRFGDLRSEFVVDMEGTWDGTELVLDEHFRYADGKTERRVWRITRRDEHTYVGTAGDVVGTASGVSYGNALNWRYTMDLKVGSASWRVAFNDWMYLQPGGVVLNRARVSKWGISIGEVTVAFAKPAEGTHAPAAFNLPTDGVAAVAR